MCLNTLTTYLLCLHPTLSQLPCSRSRASSQISLFNFFSSSSPAAHKTTQEEEFIDAFCPACDAVWDSLHASQAERRERTTVFREQNSYFGQLAPLRREGNGVGGVVFDSHLENAVQGGRVDGAGLEAVAEGGRKGFDVKRRMRAKSSVDMFSTPLSRLASSTNFLESPCKIKDSARPSVDMLSGRLPISPPPQPYSPFSMPEKGESLLGTTSLSSSDSPGSIELSSSASSTSTLWPGPFDGGEKNALPVVVERDGFGNPVEFSSREDIVRARFDEDNETELRELYRDREMRRKLQEEPIRPVAPMVAPKLAVDFSGQGRRRHEGGSSRRRDTLS